MRQTLAAAVPAATDIRAQIFPTASAFLLAGSVVRDEATASSDLDLVVVLDRVEAAQRQSFVFDGWPVEAFIHDARTLEYFFRQVDRPTGVPSLANMVSEAIELPQETDTGRSLKDLAGQVLDEGPIPWGQTDRDTSRYVISDLVEDIRAPRNSDELRIVAARLYAALADHFLRSRGLWSAKGKSIPRRLRRVDPEFQQRATEAFEAAILAEDTDPVIRLCENVLEPDGGFLFEGYTRQAPKEWRMPDP
ncbi:nucleotidyltransferase domain-containing protein [Marinovum sp.]|uniref:nucleotidyltransferase domain-containing protein n=1 Tax=Marinovum sp. TaxID=2024839 RepID=UPI002B277D79|nr:nucleotidyltransferase domain-containing protein [Marinovum sp.]